MLAIGVYAEVTGAIFGDDHQRVIAHDEVGRLIPRHARAYAGYVIDRRAGGSLRRRLGRTAHTAAYFLGHLLRAGRARRRRFGGLRAARVRSACTLGPASRQPKKSYCVCHPRQTVHDVSPDERKSAITKLAGLPYNL